MKKVYRSRHTKVLGGVAAGLADYFGMDVTVMRLLFALLLVTVPNAIIAYILAWIIIPEEPLEMNVSAQRGADTGGATMTEKTGQTPGIGMTADEILKNQSEPYVPDVPGAPQSELQPAQAYGQPASTPVSTTVHNAPATAAPMPSESRHSGGSVDRSRQLMGYILIGVGTMVIVKKYVPSFIWRLPTHLIGRAWPLLIILAGIAIIFGAVRGR